MQLAALIFLAALAPLVSLPAPRAMGSLPVACAVLGLRLPPVDRTLAGAVAGFLALCLSSALWSADPAFVAERVAKIAYLVTAGFVLHGLARGLAANRRRWLAAVLLVAFVLGAALLLDETANNYPLYRLARGLAAAKPVGASEMNRPAVVLVLLVWPAVLAARRFVPMPVAGVLPLVLPLALPLALLGVVLTTESQSALLGLLVGLLVFGLAAVSVPLARGLVVAGLVVGLLAAPWIARELVTLKSAVPAALGSASVAERMEIWAAVADTALERPLLGWGLEATRNMPHLLVAPTAPLLRGQTAVLHPHNAALQIWLELGLLGVLAALAVLLLFLRRIAAMAGLAGNAALAAFATVLVLAAVSHGLWQSWWLGVLGTLAALVSGVREVDPGNRDVASAGDGVLK